ncbi:CPBP family glutamic-type intramembrane protease [Micromonospora sp. WMMD1082]|uniref:CPBP family glutamic-type intramembrane protease n=1 Tax=Micromonospora sp. WMMD1082 TaxID=3016104 RepID=UPI002417D32D|nr:CPBP family glutamic-type intramembrane protease [Micromonospora sp. WMMD1082]MDG4795181.1 CPBP family glutamic-type intramembrane protease [Micromonospora sp. WMMD1082]
MPMLLPADTPYHRITREIPWWRTLLTLFAVLIGAQFAMLPAVLVSARVAPEGLPILGGFTALALSFVAVGCVLPVALLIVRRGEGRSVGTLSSVTGRLRWGWLCFCAFLAVASVIGAVVGSAVVLTFLSVTGSAPPPSGGGSSAGLEGLGGRLTVLPILLCLILGQAAAEEYVSRGIVLQAVGRFTRSAWPAIAVQALVFTALHGIGDSWAPSACSAWASPSAGSRCVPAGWKPPSPSTSSTTPPSRSRP